MKLRIATFNIENLFSRIDFRAFGSGYDAERARRYLPPVVNFLTDFRANDLSEFDDFRDLMRTATVSQDDDKRQHTALAMHETDAHLVCLQEVDSVSALMRFRDQYLKKLSANDYKQVILHEGNDPRGIDVAAMATDIVPLMSRSYAHVTRSFFGDRSARDALITEYPIAENYMNGRGRIFNRDCLELEIRKQGKELTVFVCHFKSMGGGGRDKTMGERTVESLAVRKIIQDKFDDPAGANWIVLGDLNDYRSQLKVRANGDEELVEEDFSGFDPLIDNNFSINISDRRDANDRWTHYYAGGPTKTQLDYILVSPALAAANPDVVPHIVRSGMPYRVPNSDDIKRYPRVGWDRPKASDHCPVFCDITVP